MQQNMAALHKANKVRLARAEMKKQIVSGETTVADIVMDGSEAAHTWALQDVLKAQHRWGDCRTKKFLASIPMSGRKTIGSLTDRQRDLVIGSLAGKIVSNDPFERVGNRRAWANGIGSPSRSGYRPRD